MISTVKRFFDKHIKSSPGNKDNMPDHSLQIATAALLIEMMRADTELSVEEQKKISETIRTKFQMTDTETAEVLQLAEEKIWKSTGYFEFTSLLNKRLSHEQKIKVVEHLWEVAFADAILDKHEEYMVRKISGLIHVSHKDFIETKLRVKKSLTPN